ncbi:MAG: P-II family nitrogen regulator, partial [Deltaproteobacteria bacterium]|nr:P-II family nitrogen regulator [Deltaproteobacteria bacterium]
FGRGRGVRERMGFLGRFIKPEKEVVLIITRQDQTDAVFEAVQQTARLTEQGTGFAFLHKIDRAIGFLP